MSSSVLPTGALSRALVTVGLGVTLAACFPREPGPRLGHFFDEAPRSGEAIPELELVDLHGEAVAASSLIGQRPVVLQVGSHSCPVYRARRRGMARLYERYRDRVDFYVVYTREAHPVGSESPYVGEEWDIWINKLAGVRVRDAEDLEARLELARDSRARLDIEIPMLVDPMADEAWAELGRAPSPAFVVAADGTVALTQVWTDPEEIESVLRRLLDE